MARGVTDSRHYENIADAIRDSSFGYIEGPIPPSQMAGCIEEISEVAHQEGIQSQYDRFWDAYQANGSRTGYIAGFAGTGWTAEIFHPKYDIVAANAYNMFYNFSYQVPINLKQLLTEGGITLTFPKCANISGLFDTSGITDIGELDFSTATRLNCTALFNYCLLLKSIEKIILPVGQTTFNQWFRNCPALENVTFEGTINANDFNVSWSTELTHGSLMSIINCLADNSGAGTAWTVTFGAENLAKLTDAEKAMATEKGWTLA